LPKANLGPKSPERTKPCLVRDSTRYSSQEHIHAVRRNALADSIRKAFRPAAFARKGARSAIFLGSASRGISSMQAPSKGAARHLTPRLFFELEIVTGAGVSTCNLRFGAS